MSAKAIRKLRIQFILVATLAYMTAMMLMGAILYATNALVTNRQINSILDYIVENEGELPDPAELEEAARKKRNAQIEAEGEEGGGEDHGKISMEDIFGSSTGESYSTPEFLYSTRYFAVIFNEEKEPIEVKINYISTVDEEDAISYATTVLLHYFSRGIRGVYFYKKATLKNGNVIVVFLDSRNQVATRSRLFYTTLIVLGFGLFIVLFIMHQLSYRIIQPEIENARRQEQFITNASHELKTPLAVIRANTEVEQMLHGEDEWNTSTLRQVDRMTSLIQNLVLISRAKEKSEDSAAVLVDVSSVLKDTIKTFAPVATQEGKKMSEQLAEGLTILGEESEIRQLASLLIDNAIKYCDEAGEIMVLLQSVKKTQVKLTVSNSYAEGENINYSRFFDRFYRQDEAHSIDKGGFGIGLSIAESLVHQYRGSISASWKDGVISFTCLLRGSVS
ncbi:MAG: GHKL domain-containing protein [Blautia sp.]|nr:GHKL domain-containing protein [Blautia sp.]